MKTRSLFTHRIASEVPITFLAAIFYLSIKKHFLASRQLPLSSLGYKLWGKGDWAIPLWFHFCVFKMKFCLVKGFQRFLTFVLSWWQSLKNIVVNEHLRVYEKCRAYFVEWRKTETNRMGSMIPSHH